METKANCLQFSFSSVFWFDNSSGSDRICGTGVLASGYSMGTEEKML